MRPAFCYRQEGLRKVLLEVTDHGAGSLVGVGQGGRPEEENQM